MKFITCVPISKILETDVETSTVDAAVSFAANAINAELIITSYLLTL
jgi:hypothetical protein